MLNLPQQKLIRYLDTNLKKQGYGTATLTVIVKNGEPIIQSARLVKMRRIRYKLS